MTSKQDFTDEEWARIRRAPWSPAWPSRSPTPGGRLRWHRQNPLGDFRPRGGQQVLEELRAANAEPVSAGEKQMLDQVGAPGTA